MKSKGVRKMDEYITLLLSFNLMFGILFFVVLTYLPRQRKKLKKKIVKEEPTKPEPVKKQPFSALDAVFKKNFGHSQEVI